MDKYGLVGYPLGHSFSRDFFNEKFKNEGINAEYVNFEIPSIERFPEIITENANLCGLNVTIPYKEKNHSIHERVERGSSPYRRRQRRTNRDAERKTASERFQLGCHRIHPLNRTVIGTDTPESLNIRYWRGF